MTPPAHNLSLLNQPIIYQVFVGRWESANVLDHKTKVFSSMANIPLKNLRNIGIDTIYLMGVFDNTGPIIVENEEEMNLVGQKNRYPSPFAITDHKNTNPDLGSVEELKQLLSKLKNQGFKVILDFVPNHTSTVHPWTKDQKDYYVANESFVREFSGDVYKLNYDNKKLREEMIDILKTINSWGADGVRCDMAHLIPLDFWTDALEIIEKENPSFIFIAEAYSDSVFDYKLFDDFIDVGFDGIYHHALYENLKKVYKNNQPKSFLSDHISYINSIKKYSNHLINYLDNHDDHSPASNQKDLIEALEFVSSCNGYTFLYNGTLNLYEKRIPHHYIDVLPDNYNEVFNLPEFIYESKHTEDKISKDVLAIDIGGTNIKSALVNVDGKLSKEDSQHTKTKDYDSLLKQVLKIIDSYDKKDYSTIGLSVPGIFDTKGENIFPGSNLPFMVHHNLKEDVKKKHDCDVLIENDANCFALAESKWGVGKGKSTIIGITWGTGIGSGIIIDGRIHHGTGSAGEFGHISTIGKSYDKDPCVCGLESCLEKCASGAAIMNKYGKDSTKDNSTSVEEIFMSMDKNSNSIISEAIYYLGIGIADLIKILSPDIVILGGGLSLMSDSWYHELRHVINDHIIKGAYKTEVLRHSLSHNAGLLGIAAISQQQS